MRRHIDLPALAVNALLALWPFWLAGTWIATVSGLCLGIYRVERRKKESA